MTHPAAPPPPAPPPLPPGAPSLGRWAVAVVASLLPVWAVSSLLSDSVDPMVFDPQIGRAVPVAGTMHRSRSEAWSQSHAGRHGIWGLPDIRALPGPKVAIWGNSHVEGVMLPDEDKMAQQVTDLWRSRYGTTGDTAPLTAYGVGIGGGDIASVDAFLDRYASVARPTLHHFVIVPDMAFLAPRAGGHLPALRPAPHPRFEPAPTAKPSPGEQQVLRWLHWLRVDFPYHLYDDARQMRLRWRLGRARSTEAKPLGNPPWTPTPALIEAWSFLLDAIQQRAGSAPVSYLYCPRIPVLEAGEIRFDDPDALAFEHFRGLCTKRGITCRSVGDAFIQAFRDHGVFARGFALNHPYRGHLNRHGNAEIAHAVVTILNDAVHAD